MKNFTCPAVLFLFFFFGQNLTAQINYSEDFQTNTGDIWKNTGSNWARNDNKGGSCTGKGLRKRVSNFVNTAGLDFSVRWLWNSTPITGHTGGEITVNFKTKLTDPESPYTDQTASEWGNFKVYYKSTLPTDDDLGTEFASLDTATSCEQQTVSFTPIATISNLYISFKYTRGSGINFIKLDDFNITSEQAPECAINFSPANGALNITQNQTFSWDDSPTGGSATSYDFYLSAANGDASTLSYLGALQTSSTGLTNLVLGATYLWSIVPQNAAGSASQCEVNSFTIIAQPAGRNCETAIEITPGVFNDVMIANGSGGASQNNAQDALWYSFTPVNYGTISISSCASSPSIIDTRVFVYKNGCDVLTTVANDDDGCGDADNFKTYLEAINVNAGQEYLIEWDDAYDNNPFDWQLTFTQTPEPNPTYYVAITGDDSNDGLTQASAFASLSKAVSETTDGYGTTINIGPGTYTDENITISKSDITINGAGTSSTIFNGDSDGRFATIAANNITINNLTVKQYGLTTCTSDCFGGAIIIYSGSSNLVFNDLIFDSNVNDNNGGDFGAAGVMMIFDNVSLTINSSIFKNNRMGAASAADDQYYGGVFFVNADGFSTLTVNNSLFYNNSTRGTGPVLFSGISTTTTFKNCTFDSNVAWGTNLGVVGRIDSTNAANVINSIIWNTKFGTNPGYDITSVVATNIVYGSGTNNSLSGNNTTNDPLFTDTSSFDYTLQLGSPAIDLADSSYAPQDDLNDLARPQGLADDIGAFEKRNCWLGTINSDWNTPANWSKNTVPTTYMSPVIELSPNNPVITADDGQNNDGDVILQNITIKTGASLTIEKGNALKLMKNFTNNGSVTLNSDSNEYASIIVGGISTGNIIYNKFVNQLYYQEWDLVGSPVVNQSINDFVTTNDDPLAVDPTGPTYYALGTHDAATNSFTNYTGATVGGAGNFMPGKGYQMATDSGATMAFTGEVATTTQTISIQNQNGANGGVGVRWNLVANPFPSYLNGNNPAGGTNFLNTNEDLLEDQFEGVYGWKADGSGYEIYNHTRGSAQEQGKLLIAPGQAFFVAAKLTAVKQLVFTPAMQTTQGGDDFISGTPQLVNHELVLKLYHANAEKANTRFYFQQGLTPGLNPGYDAGALNQEIPLSSRLPQDDQQTNYSINAMSLDDINNQSIPLVINQAQGQDFRIGISQNTLPEHINVYLEDIANGTLHSLKQEDFELTPQNNLSDAGRFYLHFTTQNLNADDILNPNNIQVYKLNTDGFITIKGLTPKMGKTTASLYNMLGMLVCSKTINNTQSTQRISTQGISAGVYAVKLKANDQQFVKKVIIQ